MQEQTEITYEQFRMKLQPLVDEISDWFDFGKAAKVAKYQKKVIFFSDDSTGITTESELREYARKQIYRLADEVWEKKTLNDFVVFEDNIFACMLIIGENFDDMQLSLRYVVAEWTAESPSRQMQ